MRRIVEWLETRFYMSAVKVVEETDLSTTPLAGAVPRGRPDGTLDPGWLDAPDYNVLTGNGDILYARQDLSHNVALTSAGASATGSSTYAGSASNVIDTDPATEWHSNAPITNQYLAIDLGQVRDIVSASLTHGADGLPNHHALSIAVEYSLDNSAWSLAGTIANPSQATAPAAITFGLITARYWRFRATNHTGSVGWSVVTVELITSADPIPTRLPIGSNTQVLTVDGGIPAWKPANATQLQGQPIGTTVPTTGQVLKWSGTQWTPATDNEGTGGGGGGGGGDGMLLPLDVVPTVPHACDDEFTGTTLDSKWQQISPLMSTVCEFHQSWLYMFAGSGAGNSGKRGSGLYQVAPTGSFSVAIRLAHRGSADGAADDVRIGVFIGSTTGNTATVLGSYYHGYGNTNAVVAIGFPYSETVDIGGYDGYHINIGGPIVPMCYKIVYNAAASKADFYYSQDGVFWNYFYSRTSYGQPNRIGLVFFSNSSTLYKDHAMGVDWFRVTE